MCSNMVIFWGKKSIFDHFIWKKKIFWETFRQMEKIQQKKKKNPRPGNEGFFFPLNFLI